MMGAGAGAGAGTGEGTSEYGNATTPRQVAVTHVQCREGRWTMDDGETRTRKVGQSSVSGQWSHPVTRQARNRIVDPFFAIGAGCRTGLHKPSSWLSPGMELSGHHFLRCDKDLGLPVLSRSLPLVAGGALSFRAEKAERGSGSRCSSQVVCYEVTPYLIHSILPVG